MLKRSKVTIRLFGGGKATDENTGERREGSFYIALGGNNEGGNVMELRGGGDVSLSLSVKRIRGPVWRWFRVAGMI